MKKTYTLPEAKKLNVEQNDILTLSFIFDETNRENVVKDPFAPPVSQTVYNHQEA